MLSFQDYVSSCVLPAESGTAPTRRGNEKLTIEISWELASVTAGDNIHWAKRSELFHGETLLSPSLELEAPQTLQASPSCPPEPEILGCIRAPTTRAHDSHSPATDTPLGAPSFSS